MLTGVWAPVTAITARPWQTKLKPPSIASMQAMSEQLPTARLAARRALRSNAPDLDTPWPVWPGRPKRSEEHTSELQSLMRISYAVFCLKNKTKSKSKTEQQIHNSYNTHIPNHSNT